MRDLAIEYRELAGLVGFQNNARTHSKKQIRQIADSIKSFGFTNPVLIDDQAMILAGHGRVEAARSLGMDKVPCVRLASLSEAQKRAYVLADNKLALNAGWDEEILAKELQFLLECPEINLDLTGFEPREIDILLDEVPIGKGAADPAEDRLPPLKSEGDTVTRLGDLWLLGPHRLLCGNALSPEAYSCLMGQEKAQMVFTDPPYNVPIQGYVGGHGSISQREFAMGSGEMGASEFRDFLTRALHNLARHSEDGSIHYVCMDWRHLDQILAAGTTAYTELKNICVWVKDNGGMGSFYRSRHELVLVFKSGTARHRNNFELGQHGRFRTNVWEYRGLNSRKAERMEELSLHPTVKPVALIADAIRDVSARGGIILDPFAGSGSTLIAAHQTARHARLIELDPIYCDRILARYEAYAKDDAVHAETGLSFRQLKDQRSKLASQSTDAPEISMVAMSGGTGTNAASPQAPVLDKPAPNSGLSLTSSFGSGETVPNQPTGATTTEMPDTAPNRVSQTVDQMMAGIIPNCDAQSTISHEDAAHG